MTKPGALELESDRALARGAARVRGALGVPGNQVPTAITPPSDAGAERHLRAGFELRSTRATLSRLTSSTRSPGVQGERFGSAHREYADVVDD
jgi:hypothetical protein